ncbi:hypothetical protein [Oceanobacillus neutriphilus]|nr:hypothetical protein [Oceanobacillus neutriphilus]
MKEAERNFVKKLLDRDYKDEEISGLTSLELEEVCALRKSFDN